MNWLSSQQGEVADVGSAAQGFDMIDSAQEMSCAYCVLGLVGLRFTHN